MTAHLAECAACRVEVEQQKQLRKLIASDTRLDSVPGASFQKLSARIDAQPANEMAQRVEPCDEPNLRSNRSRYLVVALAAAVAIEAVGLTFLGGMVSSQGSGTSPEYHTVSSPNPVQMNANVRAVFAPTLTVSELQTLLIQVDLEIVGGPSATGVYSLKTVNAQESAGAAAARLRSQPGVRFAEPVQTSFDGEP
jgi:anti-sigma factor RsiW